MDHNNSAKIYVGELTQCQSIILRISMNVVCLAWSWAQQCAILVT